MVICSFARYADETTRSCAFLCVGTSEQRVMHRMGAACVRGVRTKHMRMPMHDTHHARRQPVTYGVVVHGPASRRAFASVLNSICQSKEPSRHRTLRAGALCA